MKKKATGKKTPESNTKPVTTSQSVPLMASYEESIAASTTTRRNKSAVIQRSDRFTNIEDGLIPFTTKTGGGNSTVSIRDAIILCQKAYYNVAIFRNVIDLMTEFSINNIHFQGGSKKSRSFFKKLFSKINIWGLQDRWFREFYRSGNVIVYRIDGKIRNSDVKKLLDVFQIKRQTQDVRLPIRYVIVNPSEVEVSGNINFSRGEFFKVLNGYEIQRLQNPTTEEDKELLQSLPPETRKDLKHKNFGQVLIPLDIDKTLAAFYKKQDYEPMSVPMGFPVLEDINWKMELRKMDMAITRTMQQAILLVTMGAKPEDGGVNQKQLEAMQALFANESVGRVLIADYTTKAEFVIPDIANLLDPKKYEQIDKDINLGLNNILVGGEKFANQSLKMQVFVERLKQARQAFINEFLMPEIKRISRELGFKSVPTPIFEDIELKNEVEFARIYSRLTELGILTPEEGLNALESGRLPTSEESLESQRKFKTLKDEGLYEPITAKNQGQGEAGRPPGTNTPQSTKNVSPIGASYSITKVKNALLESQRLEEEVKKQLKKKYKTKILSKEHLSIANQISDNIVQNERLDNWKTKIDEYIENPFVTNNDRLAEVDEIAAQHGVNNFLAAILLESRVDKD